MPKIKPLSAKLKKKAVKYGLTKKLDKQLVLLQKNPQHPSLNLELLEPKKFGIYSFRIDRKFRALCFFNRSTNQVEIINLTVHYH